ncbi:histidine kinase [Gordoniibacillus kamchatkensis]|uniref:histidine kinase n=1 Tax=Gordoniibacillus kamchatkensis TaxID=1590651 RepID=A0ABR5ANK8_9BACL|nr:ATP-binding protein [Paenibacillus sp. VKM B-2647]KIL42115.1 histidine kinase [Paenibacillus sp. VKM B-2647]
MRKIPVTRDGRKDSEILLISSSDVVKVESFRENQLLIHTLDEVYYFSATLDSLEEWLYEDGFRLIDRTNIVNMNYVVNYDSNSGVVTLGVPGRKRRKQASAARIHRDHIINVMEMLRIASAAKKEGYPENDPSHDQLRKLIEESQDDPYLRSYSMIHAVYERNRAEKRLVESEQRYKSLFENNPDAVCSLDAGGRIITVNPAMVKITGYAAEELTHKPIADLLLPGESTRWEKHFALALEGQTQYFEQTFIRKDGLASIMSFIHVPIYVDGGINGVYVIAKDITERKRSDELLIKSEKLSVVGQLAAGVAHEIRNPLTSLKGFVQLLKSKVNDYDHYFDIMLSELDRINFIVSEFLVIAKPQAVKFQVKDTASILLSTVALVNTQAIMQNVEITTRLNEPLPSVLCDENQIKQVFINVLNNSIEAMPDGGVIVIEVFAKNGNIVFLFTDQGVGIPEERIPRLGEPFYTTKEKGTGLGLMVSYKIIENHHGRMSITSELGRGTTVEVSLPIAQPEP